MKYTCGELLLMEPLEVYKLRLNESLKKYPKNFFERTEEIGEEKYIEMVKYLIEEKLKWSEEDIIRDLKMSTFIDNQLGELLKKIFHGSIFEAIDAVYPGKFKIWQFSRVPRNYWNLQTAKEATIWLLEEKLKWSEDDICKNLNVRTFRNQRLSGMIQILFNNSSYLAIENAYPGKFKPWQFAHVTKDYWNEETAREATIWLIEEKLGWSDEEMFQNLNISTFVENKFETMVWSVFKGNLYATMENAYPGKYKPWQFTKVPRGYWNRKTAIESVKWLIEEKLHFSDEEVCNNLITETFKENGLGGMLMTMFNNSVFYAIDATYPGKFIKVKNKIQLSK